MQPTDTSSLVSAIQTLANQSAASVPTPTIPTFNYTAPSVSDLSSQYATFLTRASKDPDIVNYYNQLLQQAQGDTTIAENYLEQDYQTGTRNVITNLTGSLQQLGLKQTQDEQTQQDSLNKRGIALTQGQDGKLAYGGGGQANTEIGQTAQNYALQQEALERSSQQNITGLAQTLNKGISQQGQNLASTALTDQYNESNDIGNRAASYMGLYNSQQAANNLAASNAQSQALNKTSAQASGNYYNRATNTGSLNGTSYNDINKWASAGGNISTNAF